jgi:hypothetical protein
MDFIHIRFESVNETVNKASRAYQSTIAMFQLTDILKKAKVTGYEKPKQNKNQSKYTQMIVLQWENVKLIVGVQKDNENDKNFSKKFFLKTRSRRQTKYQCGKFTY